MLKAATFLLVAAIATAARGEDFTPFKKVQCQMSPATWDHKRAIILLCWGFYGSLNEVAGGSRYVGEMQPIIRKDVLADPEKTNLWGIFEGTQFPPPPEMTCDLAAGPKPPDFFLLCSSPNP